MQVDESADPGAERGRQPRARRGEATRCHPGRMSDASMNRGLSTTVRLGEVETVEYQRDRGVGVTVYFGQRKGSASTADLSAKAVRETVEKACTIARYTAEDPCAGIADPGRSRARHPRPAAGSSLVHHARRCGRDGAAPARPPGSRWIRVSRTRGRSVGTHRDVRVYGNSHGFLEGFSEHESQLELRSCSPSRARTCSATTGSPARATRPSCSPATPSGAKRRSGHWRASAGVGSSTRKVPVLFAPEMGRAASSGTSPRAIRGGAQYRKSTFMLDAAGTQVLPAFMQLNERPHILRGPRECALRWRGRRHSRSRAGEGWRATGLRSQQLLRASNT